MNTYMMKSPIYYAVSIQGYQNKFGWYLCDETEDELIEFAKMVNADWTWNMRTGVLSFKDKSEGVKLNRPEHVKIGDVVVAYDDWGHGTLMSGLPRSLKRSLSRLMNR